MSNEEMIYQLLDELEIDYERLDHEPITSVIEAAEKGIVFTWPAGQKSVFKDQERTEVLLDRLKG